MYYLHTPHLLLTLSALSAAARTTSATLAAKYPFSSHGTVSSYHDCNHR